jgi:hypothetical protein
MHSAFTFSIEAILFLSQHKMYWNTNTVERLLKTHCISSVLQPHATGKHILYIY